MNKSINRTMAQARDQVLPGSNYIQIGQHSLWGGGSPTCKTGLLGSGLTMQAFIFTLSSNISSFHIAGNIMCTP